MSYDIYCYKSKLDGPDLEEAQAVIGEDNETEPDEKTKLEIAKALMVYNPRLESFQLDYTEIAKFQKISIAEAQKRFDHIELNTPEGDLATQITIFDNNVVISIPYWYSGEKAIEVFDKITNYVKIIRQTAGYFTYDPQIEKVFDPLSDNIEGIGIYLHTTEQINHIKTPSAQKTAVKPWWKFW